MLKRVAYILFTAALMVSLLAGCSLFGGQSASSPITPTTIKAAPPRGTTGTISTAAAIESSPIPVTPQGGSFKLNDPASPLNGMVLGVPPGSYPDNLNFKISYAPIEKHTFGEAFNPLTPLIKVDNGGAYADEIMELTIPVTVPLDSFAMGFIYDEKTKTLEGLPTLAQTDTSITVGTRHFSNFLISMIPLTQLKSDIDSGFRPGIDDWQFTNYGSYIAKGGHCAGQSVTALWYYVTQPDGQDLTLYGRYDNNGDKPATPDLWQDDSLGYRFASTVHHDINWNSFENKFWTSLTGVNDEWTWKLFAYSMQITGEPQEVGIYSNAGGGHDMICYRVKDGNLYIADPNYPGNTERRIEFKDGKFVPYNSGANAEEIANGNGKAYETIEYCAKTTTVSWDKIAQRWAELKAGTIGNGIFPNYQVVWLDENLKEQPLVDGYVSPSKLINIYALSKTAALTNSEVTIRAYRDGKLLNWDAAGNYELLPGVNKLGIEIDGTVDGKDKSGNPIKIAKFIDFKYFNITYSGISITPATLTGEINKDYTFTAKTDAPLDKARYDWYINDKPSQSGSGTTLSTKFAAEGKYNIAVKLFDKDSKEVGTAQALATIAKTVPPSPTQDVAATLQKTTHIRMLVTTQATQDNTNHREGTHTSTTDIFSIAVPYDYPDNYIPITWSGLSFSGTSDYMVGNNSHRVHDISGTVSADGKTVSARYSYVRNDGVGTVLLSNWSASFEISNVPFNKIAVGQTGETAGNTITKFDYHFTTNYEGNPWGDTKYLNPTASDKSAITMMLW